MYSLCVYVYYVKVLIVPCHRLAELIIRLFISCLSDYVWICYHSGKCNCLINDWFNAKCVGFDVQFYLKLGCFQLRRAFFLLNMSLYSWRYKHKYTVTNIKTLYIYITFHSDSVVPKAANIIVYQISLLYSFCIYIYCFSVYCI